MNRSLRITTKKKGKKMKVIIDRLQELKQRESEGSQVSTLNTLIELVETKNEELERTKSRCFFLEKTLEDIAEATSRFSEDISISAWINTKAIEAIKNGK